MVIVKGCISSSSGLPVTNIVKVSPRLTLIQPNNSPFPLESLVVYLYVRVFDEESYSDDTIIVTGVVTHPFKVGVGVGQFLSTLPVLEIT